MLDRSQIFKVSWFIEPKPFPRLNNQLVLGSAGFVARTAQALGWRPIITVEAGILRTITYFDSVLRISGVPNLTKHSNIHSLSAAP